MDVMSDYDPASATRDSEPFLVSGMWSESLFVMPDDIQPQQPKRLRYFSTKVTVEKECHAAA